MECLKKIMSSIFGSNKKLLILTLKSIISALAISILEDFSSTDIIAPILCVLIFKLYSSNDLMINSKDLKKNNRLISIAAKIGLIFSLFSTFYKYDVFIEYESVIIGLITPIIVFYGLGIFFKNILILIYSKLINFSLFSENKPLFKEKPIKPYLMFWIPFIIIFIIWGLYFLKDYPGDMSQDSEWQFYQAVGIKPLNNHHPIAHTLLIELIYNIGMFLFNNMNTSIALYSLTQMAIMDAVACYFIYTSYKLKINLKFCIIATLFYTLAPYNIKYSYVMWKDVLFAGFILAFMTTLWRLVEYFKTINTEKTKKPIFEYIMLFFSGIGMCLFRSNGIYVHIITLIVIICYFRKKWRPLIYVPTASLIISLIILGPVYNSMNIEKEDILETIGVPLQHVARVIKDEKPLTSEEKYLISKVADINDISEKYDSKIVDPIKDLIREENQTAEYISEHKWEYFNLWLNLLFKYPDSYLFAQIDQTYGYFYPKVNYWVYWSYHIINRANLDYEHDPKIPEDGTLAELMDEYLSMFNNIPILGTLRSIGTFTWLFIACFGLICLKKLKYEKIVFIPIFALLFTLMIAAPVYGMIFSAPIFIALSIYKKPGSEQIN